MQGWLRHIAPRLGLVLGSLLVLFLIIEGVLAVIMPFKRPHWPGKFDEQVGLLFEADTEVRWTNYSDFWVVERTNSLGFLDREPARTKRPGVHRILILGDSFVEAAQVEIDQKFHVLLEPMLEQRFPGREFETIAMGYSGAGTVNALSFYEHLGKELAPDLIVLLFVNNDFANNSPLLEAIRSGWHPYHPPRLFFEASNEEETFRRIEIDPEWTENLMDDGPPRPPWIERRLDWSRTFLWTKRLLDLKLGTRGTAAQELYASRLAMLRADPDFASRLAGWDYPDDLEMDVMFWAESMPPVFDDALSVTEHALERFLEHGRSDGFDLLLVASEGCSTKITTPADRTMLERGCYRRIASIAERLGIPIVELRPEFEQRGDLADAHFRYDQHWSPTGHRWAAEVLTEYLVDNPGLLRKPARVELQPSSN